MSIRRTSAWLWAMPLAGALTLAMTLPGISTRAGEASGEGGEEYIATKAGDVYKTYAELEQRRGWRYEYAAPDSHVYLPLDHFSTDTGWWFGKDEPWLTPSVHLGRIHPQPAYDGVFSYTLPRDEAEATTWYQVAMPWTFVGTGGRCPSAGDSVRFNVCVNNADSDAGRSFYEFHGGTTAEKDIGQFGSLLLLDGP